MSEEKKNPAKTKAVSAKNKPAEKKQSPSKKPPTRNRRNNYREVVTCRTPDTQVFYREAWRPV